MARAVSRLFSAHSIFGQKVAMASVITQVHVQKANCSVLFLRSSFIL